MFISLVLCFLQVTKINLSRRYFNWSTAAPLVLALQAFQKPLPKVKEECTCSSQRNDSGLYFMTITPSSEQTWNCFFVCLSKNFTSPFYALFFWFSIISFTPSISLLASLIFTRPWSSCFVVWLVSWDTVLYVWELAFTSFLVFRLPPSMLSLTPSACFLHVSWRRRVSPCWFVL